MEAYNQKIYIVSEIFKQGRQLSSLERFLNHIEHIFINLFPNLVKIFNSSNLENSDQAKELIQIKRFIYFFIGSIYSYIIYWFSISQIEEIKKQLKLLVFFLILNVVSISYCFHYQIRCIMSLTVSNFLTSGLKLMLTSSIIINILNGPVLNIARNFNELGKTFKCTTDLNTNLCEIHQINNQIDEDVIFVLKNSVQTLDKQNEEINLLVGHLYDEIERDFEDENRKQLQNDTNQEALGNSRAKNLTTSEKYRRKNMNRCKKPFLSGQNSCKLIQENIIKKCKENAHLIAGLACRPSYDALIGCQLQSVYKNNQSSDQICADHLNASDYAGLDENFENLAELKEFLQKPVNLTFLDHDFQSLQIDLLDKDRFLIFQDGVEAFIESLRSFSRFVQSLAQYVKILTNYTFTFVLLNSFVYHRRYLNDIKFDNHCITQYFRHVDARRYKLSKRTLLPLKKYEKQGLNYPYQLFVSAYQKSSVQVNFVTYFLIFLCIFVFVFLDQLLNDFMRILISRADIDIAYETENEFAVEVEGDGVMAKLAQSLAKNVNIKEKSQYEVFTRQCLPKLNQLDPNTVFSLCVQFVLLICLVLIGIYAKRFNRILCAYFYGKREKQRIVWLYNDILKKRVSFIRNAKKKIAFKKNNNMLSNKSLLTSLMLDKLKNFEHLSKLLRLAGIGKKYCVLCDHLQTNTSLECKKCCILYCLECWNDLNEKCVLCSPNFHEEQSWEYDFEE